MCLAALKILMGLPVNTAGEYNKTSRNGINQVAANSLID